MLLPPGFDYARADADVRQPTFLWADESVQSMDGTPLPALAVIEILLAASPRGPSFLAGFNFRTIQRYNKSISYALDVSLLAQQWVGV